MDNLQWYPKFPFRIIGKSPAIEDLVRKINRYRNGSVPIVITGETGTGKELVARNLYLGGDRRGKPFIALNCASLPRELIEGQLFGHDPHSFTGASDKGKSGLIEEAEGGILFLDEVSRLSIEAQAKLLRVLEEKEVVRVGAAHGKKVDFRLLTATNMSIEYALAQDRLLQDFYYRISGVPIPVPSLRERREDIPLLISYFMERYAWETRIEVKRVDPVAAMLLVDYDWPGNVRQLRRVVESAMHTDEPLISSETIEDILSGFSSTRAAEAEMEELAKRGFEIGMDFEKYELHLVKVALRKAHGNQKKAAGLLDMTYDQIRHYIKKHGLQPKTAGEDGPSNPTEISDVVQHAESGSIVVSPVTHSRDIGKLRGTDYLAILEFYSIAPGEKYSIPRALALLFPEFEGNGALRSLYARIYSARESYGSTVEEQEVANGRFSMSVRGEQIPILWREVIDRYTDWAARLPPDEIAVIQKYKAPSGTDPVPGNGGRIAEKPEVPQQNIGT
ncbi:MAG TPA: sigma 54-interacting transcriptional regulator [Candidatus Nanoarchaeia archaeon]|nr:sigma 54-interacting transcriptional regulator [Candidatus Nanoarchaeia archaeon]